MLQSKLDFLSLLPSGAYLILPHELIEKMHRYRQLNEADREAGGILVGSLRKDIDSERSADLEHIEIIDFTTPRPADRRSRFGFLRRNEHHLRQVHQVWKQSKMLQTYLGEWHTHAEPHPKPSFDDLKEWKRVLRDRKCILIIIGQASDWVAFWDGHHPFELTQLR